MNSHIFDLEQQIMDCWRVVDDLKMVTDHIVDSPESPELSAEASDEIQNKYGAIHQLYAVKFQQVWDTFEKVCAEYHASRKENYHGTSSSAPD